MSESIAKIEIEIQTATKDRASDTFDAEPDVGYSENRVFLGIGGREFACATEDEDFRTGKTDTFVFPVGIRTCAIRRSTTPTACSSRRSTATPCTTDVFLSGCELWMIQSGVGEEAGQ
ncbi:hypothetical protein [Bounagaea algeriensis]